MNVEPDRITAQQPLLMHNTMRIAEGHVEQFNEAVERAVDFVQAHGPQQMVNVFVDEQLRIAHSFQLYPDSDAVLEHWRLSDPYIQAVMEHSEVERLVVYGEPTTEVLEGIRSFTDDERGTRRVVGFVRQRRD